MAFWWEASALADGVDDGLTTRVRFSSTTRSVDGADGRREHSRSRAVTRHTASVPSVSARLAAVTVVAFDVGETLIDETRLWSNWADRLGLTRLTLLGALGGMAALGREHREAFELLRPGLDVDAEIEAWRQDDPDGIRNNFDVDDLYPDVRAAFAELDALGIEVVIAGNQPPEARSALAAMDLGVDRLLMSDELGVQKPAAEFFTAVAAAAGVAPANIAYVGDRVDNDVIPAHAAGMVPVLVRRGPWGALHAEWPDAGRAELIVDSLREIPAAIAAPRH